LTYHYPTVNNSPQFAPDKPINADILIQNQMFKAPNATAFIKAQAAEIHWTVHTQCL
jgi:hypothetical protein